MHKPNNNKEKTVELFYPFTQQIFIESLHVPETVFGIEYATVNKNRQNPCLQGADFWWGKTTNKHNEYTSYIVY